MILAKAWGAACARPVGAIAPRARAQPRGALRGARRRPRLTPILCSRQTPADAYKPPSQNAKDAALQDAAHDAALRHAPRPPAAAPAAHVVAAHLGAPPHQRLCQQRALAPRGAADGAVLQDRRRRRGAPRRRVRDAAGLLHAVRAAGGGLDGWGVLFACPSCSLRLLLTQQPRRRRPVLDPHTSPSGSLPPSPPPPHAPSELTPGARPVAAPRDAAVAVQPADSRVAVFPSVGEATRLWCARSSRTRHTDCFLLSLLPLVHSSTPKPRTHDRRRCRKPPHARRATGSRAAASACRRCSAPALTPTSGATAPSSSAGNDGRGWWRGRQGWEANEG